MRKSLTNQCHLVVVFILLVWAGGCVVSERKVELQGIYDRKTNTVERLREDLSAAGVDVSKLDEAALRQMIGEASASEKFVVRVSDVRRGRALTAGRTEPLVEGAAKGQKGGGKI